jgi:hypothetical protein
MRSGRFLSRFLIAVFLLAPSPAPAEELTPPSVEAANPALPKDLMLVLDNSGSMKQNDPKFLMREVVSSDGAVSGPSARSRAC